MKSIIFLLFFAVSNCSYAVAKTFVYSWVEEVQLHDRTVILVQVKTTYEKLGPLGHTTLPRDTEISFNAGAKFGVVTQLFKGYHPLLLDRHKGTWYVTIYGADYYNSKRILGQDWGIHLYGCSPAAVLSDNSKFVPLPIDDLPSIFVKPNMLFLHGSPSEHAAFNNQRLTLNDKTLWQKKYPPLPADFRICRPPKAAKIRPPEHPPSGPKGYGHQSRNSPADLSK